MKKNVRHLLDFASGGAHTKYLASYHLEKGSVVIDWAGSVEYAKENSFIAFNGTNAFPSQAELEKALYEYTKSHDVKPYNISMAYQIMRANSGIEPYPE